MTDPVGRELAISELDGVSGGALGAFYSGLDIESLISVAMMNAVKTEEDILRGAMAGMHPAHHSRTR